MTLVKHRHHCIADGNVNVVVARECLNRLRGGDTFSSSTGARNRVLQRGARADVGTERVVARQRRGACGDEVAHARQPRERIGPGTEREPKSGDLCEAARDDGGGGVVPKTHAVRDANGHGDDVLVRTAQLHAQHIRVRVRTEIPRRRGAGDTFSDVLRARCNDGGGGLLRSDFLRQVGAGDDGHAAAGHSPHFGEDFAHPQMARQLHALHQRHHGGIGRDRICQRLDDGAHLLRRQCDGDDLGIGQRLMRVRCAHHEFRKCDPREEALIGVTKRHLARHRAIATPQRDVATGVGKHRAKGGTPRTGAEHGRFHDASLIRML